MKTTQAGFVNFYGCRPSREAFQDMWWGVFEKKQTRNIHSFPSDITIYTYPTREGPDVID